MLHLLLSSMWATELERDETRRVKELKMKEGGLGRRNTNTLNLHT